MRLPLSRDTVGKRNVCGVESTGQIMLLLCGLHHIRTLTALAFKGLVQGPVDWGILAAVV